MELGYQLSAINNQRSFFYLYMVMDLYSRETVACQIYEHESGELAADLIEDADIREKISRKQVILHSNNDLKILANRHLVYQNAKSRNPQRWSGETRNWQPVTKVILKKFKKVEQANSTQKRAA